MSADDRPNDHYVEENDRVLFDDTIQLLESHHVPLNQVPTLEPGGPRRRVFFPPGSTRAAIVTCGGLCPGLNDVIRGLVMELKTHYGVSDVVGFRNGFAGLVKSHGYPLEELTVE
ncbi:MAG: 6-phosphofructokinase, partial [Nakamurella sp.]